MGRWIREYSENVRNPLDLLIFTVFYARTLLPSGGNFFENTSELFERVPKVVHALETWKVQVHLVDNIHCLLNARTLLESRQ